MVEQPFSSYAAVDDICTYWPANPFVHCQEGHSQAPVIHQRGQEQLCACRILPRSRLSTPFVIQHHSEGQVNVPNSHRREGRHVGGMSARDTRLHMRRRGPRHHQVRKRQLSLI